ncbi:MAG: nucleotide exchange factor GrpE [Pseudomonadota bacterium]|nr:nucleotide exchange factor GrpE [Pseudomonadota bacterium]
MYEKPLTPPDIDNKTSEGENLDATISSEPTQAQLRKRRIEENFRTWLNRLPEKGLAESTPESTTENETTDLYSFYRELCALRHEFRKSFHRNHDSTTRFAETLEDFSGLMQKINRRLDQHDNTRNLTEQENRRQLFLPLVDIYERFLRLHEHLEQERPKKSFWQRQHHFAELEEQRNQLAKGFEILENHFLALLEKAGVRRRICRGEKFDPATMTAVEVVSRPEIAADEVVQELSAGYSFNDQTLKLAEVIVNRGHDS